MVYLFIKNADLLPTDLYTLGLLKKCMFYLMGDVLTKIADLLVTNLSGWSAKWSAKKMKWIRLICSWLISQVADNYVSD